jgi:hypothetical protein
MENTKSLKLKLIQAVLACEDPTVLQTALQLVGINAASSAKVQGTEKALHDALLGVHHATTDPDPSSSWDDEAVADLQRSIDEVFGGS